MRRRTAGPSAGGAGGAAWAGGGAIRGVPGRAGAATRPRAAPPRPPGPCRAGAARASRHAPAAGGARARARAGAGGAVGEKKKTGVLFVCLGNICRSPTAEAMFTAVVQNAGREGEFDIDSCGTGGGNPSWYEGGVNGFSYHEGESADPRMSAAAKRRGVVLTSRSRPLRPDDFTRFEYVVGMEEKNRRAMLEALEHWERTGRNAKCNVDLEDAVSRIRLMPEFYKDEKYSTLERVPDPYYGGPDGFELALDLLDDLCTGLLDKIDAEAA